MSTAPDDLLSQHPLNRPIGLPDHLGDESETMSTTTTDEDFSVTEVAALRGLRLLGLAQSSYIVGAVLTAILAAVRALVSVMDAMAGVADTAGARYTGFGIVVLMVAAMAGYLTAQTAHVVLVRRGQRAGWLTPAEAAIYRLPYYLANVACALVVLQLVVGTAVR